MTGFVRVTCYRCGEPFGLDPATHAGLKRSENEFCCPHGHKQYFPLGPTRAEQLEKQLEEERRARQRAEQRVAMKADEAESARRRAIAFKGQATRLRNRAKAGVCPCCNRTFKQLADHMRKQHPDFQPEAPEPATAD